MFEYIEINYLIFFVAIFFGLIHLFEFSSYFSRIAGLLGNSKVTGYTYQQMCFVVTRFFYIALMPILGFLVDSGIEEKDYKWMIHLGLFLAGAFYLLSFVFRNRITSFFLKKISSNSDRKSNKIFEKFSVSYVFKRRKIFFLSSIVFCCYSLGVFVSFFFALRYSEYRVAISQLSGVVNGVATVLLTFVVEPTISREVDREDDNAINSIYVLLLGRFFGVSVLSHFFVFFII